MTAFLTSSIRLDHRYLFDTTLFIDYWRKLDQANNLITYILDKDVKGGYSILTEAELWAGASDKAKEKATKIMLRPFTRYELNITIARRAGKLYSQYKKSGLSLADCIIAATAEHFDLILVTKNTRHFNQLQPSIISVISY